MRNERKAFTHEQYQTTRALVRKAFQALRKDGFIARGNFSCCMGCASYELATRAEEDQKAGKQKKSIVFWHKQDDQCFAETGTLAIRYGCEDYCTLTSEESAKAIVEALEKQEVLVEWSGKTSEVIFIHCTEAA